MLSFNAQKHDVSVYLYYNFFYVSYLTHKAFCVFHLVEFILR